LLRNANNKAEANLVPKTLGLAVDFLFILEQQKVVGQAIWLAHEDQQWARPAQ